MSEDAFGVGRVVRIHPKKNEACKDCLYRCEHKLGTVTNRGLLGRKELYTVKWETGSCVFGKDELRRVG